MNARLAAGFAAALACFLIASGPVIGAEPVSAAGELAWIGSDALDAVGRIAVRIPLPDTGPVRSWCAVEARTALERPIGDFTFAVRHLDYDLEAGAAWAAPGPSGLAMVAGQSGLERVDADGQPYVRYAALGWESRSFGRPAGDRPFDGRILAAVIVDRTEVDARYLARGAGRATRAWSKGRWGADLSVDTLFGGDDAGTDFRAGPRVDFTLADGRLLGLFARWMREDTKIGLGIRGVAVGFEIAEGPGPAHRAAPPDVAGTVAAGVRDGGRPVGRFRLEAAFPSWGRGVHPAVDVDAFIRTADILGDLYYLYTVGLQRERRGLLAGGWFYHRSNHVLAEPNDDITSLNVLEGGIESRGWTRPPGAARPGRRLTIDWRARGGVLLSSSFGEDRRWHVRGGARLALAAPGRARAFAVAEIEDGDIATRAAALGVALPSGVEVRAEVRRDEQTYTPDVTTVSLWTSLSF